MNNIYVTSDLHFCHKREFLYQPRGFKNEYEMGQAIIKNFNEIIDWTDDLYILGDVMLNDNDTGIKLLNQLPGQHIYIIPGNHDTTTRLELYKQQPRIEVLGLAEIIQYEGYRFYLSHYPTFTTNFNDDKKMKARLLSLSGHTHSKEIWQPACPSSYNVALDAHNNYPCNLADILMSFKEVFDK